MNTQIPDRCKDCKYVDIASDRWEDICSYHDREIDVNIFEKIPCWCTLRRDSSKDHEL